MSVARPTTQHRVNSHVALAARTITGLLVRAAKGLGAARRASRPDITARVTCLLLEQDARNVTLFDPLLGVLRVWDGLGDTRPLITLGRWARVRLQVDYFPRLVKKWRLANCYETTGSFLGANPVIESKATVPALEVGMVRIGAWDDSVAVGHLLIEEWRRSGGWSEIVGQAEEGEDAG